MNRGFSLIELLLVVVIIGILAAIGVPSLIKSREAAQKGAAIATLRTMHTNQLMYYTQKHRFARLSELNAAFGQTFGTTVGSRIYRGGYQYLMSPTPSDSSLKNGYQIIVYKLNGRTFYPSFFMNQTGTVHALLP
jgi:prepilin-type N-terminal cleavage/methylation domain-containing protein